MPIVAPEGVINTIMRDDEAKERILRPMFGDEWATERTFPNTAIRDGESVSFDNATFTVIDLGPSESPHDSPWLLGDDQRTVFLGDQIYDHKHRSIPHGTEHRASRRKARPYRASSLTKELQLQGKRALIARSSGGIREAIASDTRRIATSSGHALDSPPPRNQGGGARGSLGPTPYH